MGELDTRIRAGRDVEQTAEGVQQIGETLRTLTTEAAVAAEQTKKAAELFESLTRNVRTTEDETRRATEALRALTEEAEARTKSLRKHHQPSLKFWNRGR